MWGAAHGRGAWDGNPGASLSTAPQQSATAWRGFGGRKLLLLRRPSPRSRSQRGGRVPACGQPVLFLCPGPGAGEKANLSGALSPLKARSCPVPSNAHDFSEAPSPKALPSAAGSVGLATLRTWRETHSVRENPLSTNCTPVFLHENTDVYSYKYRQVYFQMK